MGAVPQTCEHGSAHWLRSLGRCPRLAAGRARISQLEGAALDRRPAAAALSMAGLSLPTASGGLERYQTAAAREFRKPSAPPFNRVALAAAHVVADPLSERDPWLEPAVDWERTLAYRHYLWGLGLGVAEAMDTAQRGAGLDWRAALELIKRSVASAAGVPGAVLFCGAGTISSTRPAA